MEGVSRTITKKHDTSPLSLNVNPESLDMPGVSNFIAKTGIYFDLIFIT
jgi:hypothetical protein